MLLVISQSRFALPHGSHLTSIGVMAPGQRPVGLPWSFPCCLRRELDNDKKHCNDKKHTKSMLTYFFVSLLVVLLALTCFIFAVRLALVIRKHSNELLEPPPPQPSNTMA